jgi:hypothetical protein
VSRAQLIEELLDRIVERGNLSQSELRDALARNQLKLADLAGPVELFAGDPLLRANRALADRAPGVYHRGEVYLRWLHRASALAFGTRSGRTLTLFLALPFGAALATIVFAQEMLHIARLPHHLHQREFESWVVGLGAFYFLLIHLNSFRAAVATSLRAGWIALRSVFFDLPVSAWRLPFFQRLIGLHPRSLQRRSAPKQNGRSHALN